MPRPLWWAGSVVCFPLESSPTAWKSSASPRDWRIEAKAPTPSSLDLEGDLLMPQEPPNIDSAPPRVVDGVVDHLREGEVQDLHEVRGVQDVRVNLPESAALVAPDLVLAQALECVRAGVLGLVPVAA